MQILKNILIVLAFCAVGILLGMGAFALQKHTKSSTTSDSSTSTTSQSSATSTPSPSSSASASSGQQYSNTDSGVSFQLPTDLFAEATTLTGYATGTTAIHLQFIRAKSGSGQASATATSVYIITTATDSALTTAKNKLLKAVLTKTASETTSSQNSHSLTVTKKSYAGIAGSTEVSYEVTSGETYILIYRAAESSDPTVTDAELSALTDSLQIQSATASATPTTTTSPILTTTP